MEKRENGVPKRSGFDEQGSDLCSGYGDGG